MSFVEQEDLIERTEALMPAVWSLIGVRVPTPIARSTYAEAMDRYQREPDLRSPSS